MMGPPRLPPAPPRAIETDLEKARRAAASARKVMIVAVLAAVAGWVTALILAGKSPSPTNDPGVIAGVPDPNSLIVRQRVEAIRAYLRTYADDPESLRWVRFVSIDRGGEMSVELDCEPYQHWVVFYRARNTHGAMEFYKRGVTFEPGTGTWSSQGDIKTVRVYSPRPEEE